MNKKEISKDVMHRMPADLRKMLISSVKAQTTWEDITPLARNEWICWVESAIKSETRDRRMRIMLENLGTGKRRPCCWIGCTHRR